MKKELQKLMLERYKWLMLGIVGVILLVCVQNVYGGISNWNYQNKELNKPSAETQFYKDLKDPDYGYDGKMYLYWDEKTGKDVTTSNFEEYKNYQLKVFADDKNEQQMNLFYSEPWFQLTVIAVILGMSVFFFDLKTNFNPLLFSSRFRRQDIYTMKIKLLGGTFLGTLVISKLIVLLALVTMIPKEYLNATFMELLPSQIGQIAVLSFIFMASSFAGLILGEWISGILTLVGFWYTLPVFIGAFPIGLISKEKTVFTGGIYFNFYSILEMSKATFASELFKISLAIGLSIVFYLWGKSLYSKVTLENNGSYLLFNHLRKPVQIVFTFYAFMIMASGNLFEAIEINITGKNPYGEFIPSLPRAIAFSLVCVAISYLIASLVIYRKNPFRKIGKKEALLPAE